MKTMKISELLKLYDVEVYYELADQVLVNIYDKYCHILKEVDVTNIKDVPQDILDTEVDRDDMDIHYDDILKIARIEVTNVSD